MEWIIGLIVLGIIGAALDDKSESSSNSNSSEKCQHTNMVYYTHELRGGGYYTEGVCLDCDYRS